MKLTKYLFILSMLFIGFVACDDDENEDPQGGNGSGTAEKVAVSFAETGRTVLRNGGQVQIPIRLEKATTETVRVNIGVEDPVDATIAEEGIDFNIEEKVVNIAAGDTVGYVVVDVLDDGKANNDKSVNFTIKSVYGAGVKAEANQSFTLQITSNAFVTFTNSTWQMYEASASSTATEEVQNMRFIPLTITGDLTSDATVVFEVFNGTAEEPTHFTVEKNLTLTAGMTEGFLEVLPVDDAVTNTDRTFGVRIKEVRDGNLIVGSEQDSCAVTIVSEEVLRNVTFDQTAIVGKEGSSVTLGLVLDHAPTETSVDVTIETVAGVGNAVENEDYTLSAKTVTFLSGETRKYITINLPENNTDLWDKTFQLRFYSATSDATGTTVISDVPVEVTIQNNDLPYFAYATYNSREGSGGNTFPVYIPNALEKDVVLHAIAIDSTAAEGTNFEFTSFDITIPAGSTQGSVAYTMLAEREYKEKIFKVAIIGVDEYDYSMFPSTNVKVVEDSGYRKWLGECSISTFNATRDSEMRPGDTDEDWQANFGKSYIVNGINGWADWWVKLIYNRNNNTISIGGANNAANRGCKYTWSGVECLGSICWRDDASMTNWWIKDVPLSQTDDKTLEFVGVKIGLIWYRVSDGGQNTISDTGTNTFKIVMK